MEELYIYIYLGVFSVHIINDEKLDANTNTYKQYNVINYDAIMT